MALPLLLRRAGRRRQPELPVILAGLCAIALLLGGSPPQDAPNSDSSTFSPPRLQPHPVVNAALTDPPTSAGAKDGPGGPAFAALTGVHSVGASSEGVPLSTYGTTALVLCTAALYAKSYRQAVALSATEEKPAPAKQSKPRIDGIDSLRFFLILYIASGHFIHTATKSQLILRLLSQINVTVGGFFAITGYVTAYTTTEIGATKYNAQRLDNPVQFVFQRIMGFWPLHMLLLVLFSPMFLWTDWSYSGGIVAGWHAFLSTTLTQSWFPVSAQIWNAPTWYISALAFSLIPLSYALKVLAGQTKAMLRRSLVILTVLSLIPKVAYTYDLKAFGLFEGLMSARSHPNMVLFNALRFNPFYALLEILMGAVACRLVMLDSEKDIEETGSSVWPLLGMIAIFVLRATGLVQVNDLLTRTCVFLPLFLVFLMRLHRETVCSKSDKKPLVKIMNTDLFKWLGSISFPIFMVHGPLGQLFYKKAVAAKLWGGSLARIPGFFGIYWLIVIICAHLLQKYFVTNKKVGEWSKSLTGAIVKKLT